MDRYTAAGEDHTVRAAVLEEYLRLAYADSDGAGMFEVYAWTQSLAEDYLALGRVDDAVRVVLEATRRGDGEGAELLCELAERLMRSGHEPTARGLWERGGGGGEGGGGGGGLGPGGWGGVGWVGEGGGGGGGGGWGGGAVGGGGVGGGEGQGRG